jgi:hypothetical protein
MRRSAIALVFLVVASTVGFAQTNRGAVAGTVTSPDGAVGGATVEAREQSTGRVYAALSGKAGRFRVADLPAGTYEISVPALGIASVRFVQPDIVIGAGKTTPLDIALVKANHGVLGDDNAYLAIHNKYADVRGPAPRMRDGRPDLSGVWNANGDPHPAPVSMLPWAVQVMETRRATNFRDHPGNVCLPDPTPTLPLLHKFVQTRTLIVQLFEQEPHYRQIFLDGRAHPKDPDPGWMGHSIGKWEKDALVVDTTGFNDKSWIIFAAGLPHTEMLHMIERYRRPDLGHLTIDLTLEDPGTFTKPIERHMTWELAPGEEILENICNENNKFRENAGLK